MWLLAWIGCGGSCEVEGPLDYGNDAHWLCLPGDPSDACPERVVTATVAEDGTRTPGVLEAANEPDLACFILYPTLDLRLTRGLQDVDDRERPERWARVHGGPLQQVCSVYAPLYRQARLGTYLSRDQAGRAACFETAYADVEAAFEAFLAREPERPFVLLGHSQGSAHLNRLVHTHIEGDPALLRRWVASYPVGSEVTTAADAETGGTFDTATPCREPEQTACYVTYRSLLAAGGGVTRSVFAEGPETVCVHPGGSGTLAGFVADADDFLLEVDAPFQPGTLAIWPEAFEASCTGTGNERGLSVRWVRSDTPPIDLDARLLQSEEQGSHGIDLSLGLLDIVADIRRRRDAWVP